MNAAASFLYHWLVDRPDRWYPLIGFHYLTYACDFSCPYCSDGAGRPYWSLRSPTLTGDRVQSLWGCIRRQTDCLVITGGEPLQHPEFPAAIQGLPRWRFKKVLLTTNGYRLHECLAVLAGALTELVVSLDTLDHALADAWYGQGDGTLRRILANLELAAADRARRYELVISSVVTPWNIDDLYAVYEYAQRRGFRFAACPQLVGVKAHPELHNHPAYRRFYDFLIAEQAHGANIEGPGDSLECLRDLRPFRCRPFTMLVVSPTGDVFYPCLEIGHIAGNLLEQGDLHQIRRNGRARFGPPPACGNQCHSACAVGFARMLEHPGCLLREAGRTVRRKLAPRVSG